MALFCAPVRLSAQQGSTFLAAILNHPDIMSLNAMSSVTAARSAARSARVSGLSRFVSGASVSARALSTAPTRVAPRIMLPRNTISRSFTYTHALYSKDTTWQTKGPVRYAELKPETEAPTGEITLIDVREPNEVEQGMIPSAVNVPLSKFNEAFTRGGGDFQKDFAFSRPGYDDKIVFYCRSGKRSEQALEFAQRHGWWK